MQRLLLALTLLACPFEAFSETVYALGYDVILERGMDSPGLTNSGVDQVRARAEMDVGDRITLIDNNKHQLTLSIDEATEVSVRMTFVVIDAKTKGQLLRAEVEAAVSGITEFRLPAGEVVVEGSVGIGAYSR